MRPGKSSRLTIRQSRVSQKTAEINVKWIVRSVWNGKTGIGSNRIRKITRRVGERARIGPFVINILFGQEVNLVEDKVVCSIICNL